MPDPTSADPIDVRHPWLVVDTWGEKPPVGCWTEAAARALPANISASFEMGRWKARPNPFYEPTPEDPDA